ncbi:MAG: UDP-N-acetylmuramoyl-tripeptide--D-alanyl-D-alanine ligase [Clostridia bacterium]
MKDLTVKDIIGKTNGELVKGNEDLICKNFSSDTRKIDKGDVYIGIKGETFDGSKFWRQALENGASCVIVENIDFTDEDKKEFEGKTIIKVENTLEALYSIARYKRSLYKIPVIAITGSVGKTSTKDIVANVVSKKYKTLKTIGNNNNNIGLPFTILRMQDEEAMVLEMGMNHLGEISLLTSIAKPTVCVITNIGTSHIGNLGSRENILKAKLEILEGNERPTVIINNDNDLLHKWYEENKNKIDIKTYGIKEKSDLNANHIILNELSSKFTCNLDGKEEEINVPVGGEHFILNSLCAAMVGKVLKIDNEKIVKGIGAFELTKKRMDITELKNGVKVINDAYNASFESMSASLKVLSEFRQNRKIAILGDMFELGDFSKELHEKVGEEVIENGIDLLICNGDNAKHIVRKAEEKMDPKNIYYLEDKEDIIVLLEKILKPGDIILLKASNGMKFYELAERMVNLWKRKN